ncbi:MAG: xanthan lyase [Phycisphaerae bacterium]|nr:xanthan lyase [Phycisphaerae bacterium]
MLRFVVAEGNRLPGIVVDNTDAEVTGVWQKSVHTPPFVGAGYIHDQRAGRGRKSVTYRPTLAKAGVYEVRVSHNANSGRSARVPVTVHHADGETTVRINQRQHPPAGLLFRPVGRFRFEAGGKASVTISNHGTTDGHVIADAVWLVPVKSIGKAVAPASTFAKQPRLSGRALREHDAKAMARLEREAKATTDKKPPQVIR